MFYLVSFFAAVYLLIVIYTERYDFAYHNKAKRYCGRLGLIGFMILQVAVYTNNEGLIAVGLVPVICNLVMMLTMMYMDYKRENRIVSWFDRDGL